MGTRGESECDGNINPPFTLLSTVLTGPPCNCPPPLCICQLCEPALCTKRLVIIRLSQSFALCTKCRTVFILIQKGWKRLWPFCKISKDSSDIDTEAVIKDEDGKYSGQTSPQEHDGVEQNPALP